MHSSTLLLLLPLVASSSNIPPSPQHIFSNSPSSDESSLRIPTSYESAILARRILHLTPLGTLSTNFPSNTLENRPSGLEGLPIGLMDYIADCEPSGNPTILSITIATTFKNVAAGSNISLSLQWTPPYPPRSRISSMFPLFPAKDNCGDDKEEAQKSFFALFPRKCNCADKADPVPYSAANLPRFSLLGYLEKIPQEEVESQDLGKCFVETHKDARWWLPGNKIHHSEFVRLVVEQIYWVGGFGDRAYIGWIPIGEWRNVSREELEGVRLPGEKKGWKEWLVDGLDVGGWEL